MTTNTVRVDSARVTRSTAPEEEKTLTVLSRRVDLLEGRLAGLESSVSEIVSFANGGSSFPPAVAVAAAPLLPQAEEDLHLCDGCLMMSNTCYLCNGCGREWYCCRPCELVRREVHRSRCLRKDASN